MGFEHVLGRKRSSLILLHPLDQKAAYEAIQPAGLFRSLYRCSDSEWNDCPISDHLPEGGLFAFRDDLHQGAHVMKKDSFLSVNK